MNIINNAHPLIDTHHNKSLVIKSKEDELMETLVAFFKIESNLAIMIPF